MKGAQTLEKVCSTVSHTTGYDPMGIRDTGAKLLDAPTQGPHQRRDPRRHPQCPFLAIITRANCAQSLKKYFTHTIQCDPTATLSGPQGGCLRFPVEDTEAPRGSWGSGVVMAKKWDLNPGLLTQVHSSQSIPISSFSHLFFLTTLSLSFF